MATLEEVQAKQQALVLQQRQQLLGLASSEGAMNIIDRERGAPASVRSIVGAARKPEDRLSNVRRFFPDAIPFKDDNFLFTDPETNRPTLYNPGGFDFGDVASVGGEIAEFGGGVLGGAAGLMASGPTPAAIATVPIGVGLGAAAGRELFDINQNLTVGRDDTRTGGERLTDAGVTAAVNAGGQRIGDLAVTGLQRGIAAVGQRAASRAPQSAPASITDFDRAGVTPRSPGAVSGNRGVGIFEQGVANTVAGGDVFATTARETLDQVGQRVTQLADELSPVRTRVQAGGQLKRGGQEFIEGFGTEASKLEDAFSRTVSVQMRETPAEMSNTLVALEGVANRFPTNPELGKSLVEPRFQQWLDILEKSGGQLTFGELREFRSFIGRKLRQVEIVSDIPRADLERLYGSMSQDLRDMAARSGARALQAFDRATTFERQGFQRIRDSLQEVASPDSKISGERVFALVQDLAQEQGKKPGGLRKLAQIRRSVSRDQWRAVSSVILRRMGIARPNAQGASEVGEAAGDFSAATFMTEWNKLSPEARNLLFRGVIDDGWVSSLNSLNRVVGALKDVDRLANTSGTARVLQAMGLTSAAGGAVGAGLTGDLEGFATGATGLVGARIIAPRIAARLLTNPRFVRWLARAGSIALRNPNSMGRHLARLAVVSEAEPAIREEIRQYVDALREAPDPS